MFVYNFKVNGSKLFKTFFVIVSILILCICCTVIYKIFNGASKSSCMKTNEICDIQAKNYTNILKAVHDNIDEYVGVRIRFTGYVYRISDLSDSQFVLARNMIVSSDFQSVVVGFLCNYENAKDFENDSWVEITGEIVKGDYHGEMPIINVTEIKKADKPNEEFVYPPDDSYIPTSGVL